MRDEHLTDADGNHLFVWCVENFCGDKNVSFPLHPQQPSSAELKNLLDTN